VVYITLKKELVISLLTFAVVAVALLTPKYFSPSGTGIYFASMVLCTIPLAFFTRVKNKPTKTLLYFFLGFGAYWLVGGLFAFESQVSFLPFLLFGLANSLGVLSGLIEDYKYGLIFGASAFARVISSVSSPEPYMVDRLDFVLLLCVLLPAIAMMVSYLTSRIEDMKTMLMATLRAVLITTALNLAVIILEFYSIAATPGNMSAMDILSASWYYLIANAVFIVAAVSLYFLALNSLSFTREVTDQGVKYTKVAEYRPMEEQKGKKKDPFEKLMSELETFEKQIPALSRMNKVNMLGRFRKEFDIIKRKYDSPLKGKVKKKIDDLEVAVHS
jgi:hypothetical protein